MSRERWPDFPPARKSRSPRAGLRLTTTVVARWLWAKHVECACPNSLTLEFMHRPVALGFPCASRSKSVPILFCPCFRFSCRPSFLRSDAKDQVFPLGRSPPESARPTLNFLMRPTLRSARRGCQFDLISFTVAADLDLAFSPSVPSMTPVSFGVSS
jgi:hypothetical protein